MFAFTKVTVIVVSTLGLASTAVAAPVEATSNELAARAPYDVHNGWVSKIYPVHPIENLPHSTRPLTVCIELESF